MPHVTVPAPLRGPTRGRARIEAEGSTVRGCIEAVDRSYPGFGELILDPQGNAHRFVTLFLNGDELGRDALETPVAEGDELEILSAVAGGRALVSSALAPEGGSS